MMKKCICLIIYISGLILCPLSYAQTAVPTAGATRTKALYTLWRESIQELKASANAVLQQHEQLDTQRDALSAETIGLQKEVEAVQAEHDRLINEPARLTGLIQEREKQYVTMSKEIAVLEKEVTVLKKQKQSVEKKLSHIEKEQQPWIEQLADLRVQEKELTAELEEKRAAEGAHDTVLAAQVKDLRDKIAQYDTDIAEINRAIDESIARNTKTMQEIKNLKNRNKQIERELAQVEREKITYNRQLARLEKQQGTTGRSTEAQRAQKIAEKKHLQSQEDELVRQIHQTQQLIETRAGQQPDTLASLSKELAQVRQDNSLLQDKVADLDQTTQGLQRENAMVAALLDVQKDMQARPPAATVRVQPEGAPQTSNTMEAMGYALAQQGRYQEAIDYYQKALKHRGNKKDIYFNIGFIYYKMGNLRQAIRYYTYALRADPRNEEIKYTIELLKEELALSKRRK